ncbi:hypothetical protein GBF35_50470 [Nonomuraea phyllanthi]|uniref:hypothetical protein n=1 Tax=Nonomuraea phyllanthi TaxID=2219224 RepID=UPI001293BD5D|nr:hypothetical protein [Nonomuraea phyllanthi]QFY13707.1 hypothetical protein GBF35_50470 [Nonomuraea phyllanthi]
MMTTDSTARTEFIAGLRSLARFLADNPKVPVPTHGETILLHAAGTDNEQRAQVDRVADLIGSLASGGTHYKTARDFGPITYEVLAISEQHMRDHEAAASYYGAVTG